MTDQNSIKDNLDGAFLFKKEHAMSLISQIEAIGEDYFDVHPECVGMEDIQKIDNLTELLSQALYMYT